MRRRLVGAAVPVIPLLRRGRCSENAISTSRPSSHSVSGGTHMAFDEDYASTFFFSGNRDQFRVRGSSLELFGDRENVQLGVVWHRVDVLCAV
jgi:hypothetical protein